MYFIDFLDKGNPLEEKQRVPDALIEEAGKLQTLEFSHGHLVPDAEQELAGCADECLLLAETYDMGNSLGDGEWRIVLATKRAFVTRDEARWIPVAYLRGMMDRYRRC